MFGGKTGVRRRAKDEGERPFWISFADLMSALMVLFLVVMSAALLSVTKTVSEQERSEKRRADDIERVLDGFEAAAQRFPGITIVRDRRVIDFGRRAQFELNSSLLRNEQERTLREFVPEILARANDEVGRRVVKRIVVEGFTDRTGTYLGNLNLSLQRSERVLCAMFKPPSETERPLTIEELEQVRDLFLVGGYSFNAAKDTDEQSRRVEMRLEFLGVNESRLASTTIGAAVLGKCALN